MPPEPLQIRRAAVSDVDAIAPLFDAYRQFYGYPPDLPLARQFLHDRIARGESVVFLAESATAPAGFVQLYPTFSSLHPGRLFILNDLYVDPAARKAGLGSALLREAERHARAEGAVGMILSTATTNRTAQRLYESLGWVRDEEFLVYERRFA